MVEAKFFSKIADMEPMFPGDHGHQLSNLAGEMLQKAGALSRMVHPITQSSIADVVRIMNSYYSNLIEGHRTNPYDIEKALLHEFSDKPEQKDLQLESIAHIEVQRKIEKKLLENPTVDIYSKAFLCWIHKEFYVHLPESFRQIKHRKKKSLKIKPGQLRQAQVSVGIHVAPTFKLLSTFLTRFTKAYNDDTMSDASRVIAIAASHHRFSWIHPFDDGNGRVVRLMTEAGLRKNKLAAHGLWTMSRGLARNRDEYYARLAAADQKRASDFDGRGRMSESALFDFCVFFLKTAIDQINFMTSRLELDALEKRMEKYLLVGEEIDTHTEAMRYLLFEALRKGEFSRGDAARITNKGPRTARAILKDCLDRGLLTSTTERGPVRLAFPTKVLEFYFPLLYPEGIDQQRTRVT